MKNMIKEKVEQFIRDMNGRIGYSSCEINNISRDAYISGWHEGVRWRTFDEKPFIHSWILVRTKLYPLIKPKVKRTNLFTDLSKKYIYWKPID